MALPENVYVVFAESDPGHTPRFVAVYGWEDQATAFAKSETDKTNGFIYHWVEPTPLLIV